MQNVLLRMLLVLLVLFAANTAAAATDSKVARESTQPHKRLEHRKSICYFIAKQCVIRNAYIIQFGRSNINTLMLKNNANVFGVRWHYLLLFSHQMNANFCDVK